MLQHRTFSQLVTEKLHPTILGTTKTDASDLPMANCAHPVSDIELSLCDLVETQNIVLVTRGRRDSDAEVCVLGELITEGVASRGSGQSLLFEA